MSQPDDLLKSLEHLSAPQLRRRLTGHLTEQKLGQYWETSASVKSWMRNTQPTTQRDVSL